MRVELLLFSTETKDGQILLTHLPDKSGSVGPGKWKSVSLGEKTKVTVFCAEDRKAGRIIIRDPENELNAFIVESSKSKSAKELNKELPLEVVGRQQLSISKKTHLSEVALGLC